MGISISSSRTLTTSIFFIAVFYCSNSQTYPIAKPGCEDQSRCGDVIIPFPFGTREDCYLDDGFLIRCINSSQTLVGNSSMVVKEISLQGNMLALYDMVYDCYDSNNTLQYQHTSSKAGNDIKDLPGTLFYNNTANILTLIGCDVNATIDIRKATYSSVDVDRAQLTVESMVRSSSCDRKNEVEDGFCGGNGCYQTTIPNGAYQIYVGLNRSYNHTDVSGFSPCGYSFLVQNSSFHFSADNLTNFHENSSFPVLLDWVFESGETCKSAKLNLISYGCKAENSTCYDQEGAVGYRCSCQDGYEGNPYLVNGCTDIDECANSTLHDCPKHSVCLNTLGSYKCSCIDGYSKRDNSRTGDCIADQQQPQQQQPRKNTEWPTFAVISVAIGGSGIAFILAMSYCFYTRFQRRKIDKLKEEYFRKNGGFLLQRKVNGQGGNNNTTIIFNVEELQKATNDFDESNVIGRGGFGIVFKGELMDKTKVAIKKATAVARNQVEQFVNEVSLLSQINNRNVVRLLGCCLETEIPLLVYEFIDNGTLYEHLHGRNEESKLPWNIRLRIATEVAGVLSYLHSVAFPPIIHRDIKSANILLDSNYTAKVADFGISKLVPVGDDQVSTMVQGTHGYLDPEYLQTGMLTEKSDVYSFGILLIELLTGRRVFASDRPEAERFLSNYFLSSLQNDQLLEIYDSKIFCDENIQQLKETAMIAKKCISVKGENRPYMKEVVRELEAVGMKTQEFHVQTSDMDSSEGERLAGARSVGFINADDTTSTSKGSNSVCHTITEKMLLEIVGGR